MNNDELVWRYLRDHEVLYLSASRANADYLLVSHFPDGTSQTSRTANLAGLYDHLQLLEQQLGAQGWELLPMNQRAPNRLPTPVCETCSTDETIETTSRTPTHVHFRCMQCDHRWIVPKPGVLQVS